MQDILSTKSNSISIRTRFFEDSQEFGTCLCYPDGKYEVLQTFKSAMFLVEIHDFWCKFTGVTTSNISIRDIVNHIKSA